MTTKPQNLIQIATLSQNDTFEDLAVIIDRDRAKDASGSKSLADSHDNGPFRITGSVNESSVMTVESSTVLELDVTTIPMLFPGSRRPLESMKKELSELVRGFPDEAKTFGNAVLDHPLFPQFVISPAAMMNHHAFVGGLLEHTLSMLKIAQSLADHYQLEYDEMLHRGVLYCGVLMHDFAKTTELGFENRINYTTDGRLLGHIAMGFELVGEICEMASISAAFKKRLQHAVLSHHGRKDYGSPIEPCTPEAVLLHNIDMIDSRMNMCWNAVTEAKRSGSTWSEFARPLGARMYVGDQ